MRTLTAKVKQVLPEVRSHAEQRSTRPLTTRLRNGWKIFGHRRARLASRTFEVATRGIEPDVTLPDLVLPDRQHAITEYVQAPIDYIKQEDIARLGGRSSSRPGMLA